jgi:hypothetical protein
LAFCELQSHNGAEESYSIHRERLELRERMLNFFPVKANLPSMQINTEPETETTPA